MRLGVSYNFFNGEEHLRQSIDSIRNEVDYISIVAQEISNSNEIISDIAKDIICDLIRNSIIDDVIWYKPNLSLPRRINELNKRRIGLRTAIRNRCTHFFTMDADEFYRDKELSYAKNAIIDDGFNSSSVDTFMHIKRPVYRARDKTKCAFITKISFMTSVGKGRYPVDNVDSTRIINVVPRRHIHFASNEISMYHMNLVRKNIENKLMNSSTVDNVFLNKVRSSLIDWEFGKPFEFPGKGLMDVYLVENEFHSWDPF